MLGLDPYDKNYSGKFHKPYYSSVFDGIASASAYWQGHYDDLYKRSLLFSDAFYANTLPPEVMEAIASNLTILKSPTVLRQYDGRLWNWEGCGDDWVAVMAPVPMYGTMHRPWRICFPR